VEFELERFEEALLPPIDSQWSIRILHPNKLLERCNIICNDVPLVWWDGKMPPYERKIVQGGGGIVRISRSMSVAGAEIKVRNNKKILRKTKFEDILLTHP
jgi:hypothetical protein